MSVRRSALLTDPRRIEIVEEQLAPPATGQALVATRLGSVSVGTKLAEYLGTDQHLANGERVRKTLVLYG